MSLSTQELIEALNDGDITLHGPTVWCRDARASLKRALLIAEKLMSEPSEDVKVAGVTAYLSAVGNAFYQMGAALKAARAKLIEEIDHDNG